MDDEQVECSWVKISKKTNLSAMVVGVCYRLSVQKEADENWKKVYVNRS